MLKIFHGAENNQVGHNTAPMEQLANPFALSIQRRGRRGRLTTYSEGERPERSQVNRFIPVCHFVPAVEIEAMLGILERNVVAFLCSVGREKDEKKDGTQNSPS